MKKLFTANKYLPVALALAAFTCAAPAFAHSSGARSAGVSTRNARPFVHSGYSSYRDGFATRKNMHKMCRSDLQ